MRLSLRDPLQSGKEKDIVNLETRRFFPRIANVAQYFYKWFLCFVFLTMGGAKMELKAQRLSRDLNVDLLVNQVGYMPLAGKSCIAKGKIKRNFDVIDITSQRVVYSGTLQPVAGDFGEYLIGDFSQLTQAGHFYVKADTLRSYPFEISDSIYQSPMDLIVHYFALQRCGPSTTGYLSPCHLDDGIRVDNGKHQDVTGGWHDASDLRQWVDATIYGMIGLAKTYELQRVENKEAILDELKWGNQYFLKMQEPQGYVMSFVGGDLKQHSDNNRWTDNQIGEEDGKIRLVRPNAGISQTEMLIAGASDDRIIQTSPAGRIAQYNFITSEALMTRITKPNNIGYAQKCLEAAQKCFAWCGESGKNTTPGIIGAAMQASIELYKTTKQDAYKIFAIEQVSLLKELQANDQKNGVGGFFYNSISDHEPYKNISKGCLAFIALSDLVQTFPSDRNVPIWKTMITDYAHHYLSMFSNRNSFGIVPYGLFVKQNPGGSRKIGHYWYRYFMQPELDWWVGINANIASAGIGLMKAANVLKDKELMEIAQKQLDWIMGVNPFNSSTVLGLGYNHPAHFGGESFLPSTPVLPGAVLNGLGGDHADQPIIGNGDWQISEYWTPMVAYTLWLMAEISNDAG